MFCKCVVALVSLTALAACSPESGAPESETHAHHDVVKEGLSFQNPVIAPVLGGKDLTAGYFTLMSGSDEVITGASSNRFSGIELHETIIADGQSRMRKTDTVAVKAGEELVFKPKGRHLMLFGASGLEIGEKVGIEFSFESGKTETVEFEVKPVSQGGHSHH